MEFDHSKLCGRIIEKYGTRTAFAAANDISLPTLSDRLKGKSFFDTDEIVRFAESLGIPPEEIPVYFFTPKVR